MKFWLSYIRRHNVTGDLRAKEHPNLAVLHTLFLREHNRIASKLVQVNPQWSGKDEKLFQEAKRILNAEWQHIIYNEWLPDILGDRFMSRNGLYPINRGYSSLYRTDFDPRISNVFQAAGFRFGHSMIPGHVRYYYLYSFHSPCYIWSLTYYYESISTKDYYKFSIHRRIIKVNGRLETIDTALRDAFNNMDMLQRPDHAMEALIRGTIDDHTELVDANFVEDVGNTFLH